MTSFRLYLELIKVLLQIRVKIINEFQGKSLRQGGSSQVHRMPYFLRLFGLSRPLLLLLQVPLPPFRNSKAPVKQEKVEEPPSNSSTPLLKAEKEVCE